LKSIAFVQKVFRDYYTKDLSSSESFPLIEKREFGFALFEGRMLDKKTVKARLLKNEMQHVKRMVHELIQERYRKLVRKMTKEKKVASDVLTAEEEKVYKSVSLSQKRIRALPKAFFMDTYQKLMLNKNAKELLCVFQKMFQQ
jgi:hypothetical protein